MADCEPGKTILASVIVEEVRKIVPATVCFFYCKYMDSERDSFLRIARTILSQVLLQNPDLLPYVIEVCAKSGSPTLNDVDLAERTLKICLKYCARVYVVLDGLDECESHVQKHIVSFFKTLVEAQPPDDVDKIRCVFISQHDHAAEKRLDGIPSFKFTGEQNFDDIKHFVLSWAGKAAQKFELTAQKIDEVVHAVMSRTEGEMDTRAASIFR